MIGRTVSHYRVLEKLGEGGMGVVYEAEDTRLGRRVALKFLPDHLAGDHDALARFEQEARAASALNHPHICTIYDVDEAGGRPFIAMERLDGDSLRQRLARGRMGVPAVVQASIELADALDAAHAQGIVHRDIKPDNVVLTARGAKLLDFGIAKLVSEQVAAAAATAMGAATGAAAIGTVAYMSPEQARGESLDARSDLFSLGVVLYEMATGVPPFCGGTAGAMLAEILTAVPASPARLNPDVPRDLERIVNKLLEKDRALRYQSARDVRVDLERLRRGLEAPTRGPQPRPEQASIVVLPFDNLSPDPDNAFFADGLTEEIIADLSRVRALRVISRTSAMVFKGSQKSVPAIARELHVRYVLEGSVRRAGTQLRITAQLIEADADTHLWAEKYAGTLDDVFELQERLSRRIVEGLQLTLSRDEQRRMAARLIANVEALDAYLRARQEMYRLTEASLARAAVLAGQALEITGPNALLYALLGEIEFLCHDQGIRADAETLARAEAYVSRALAVTPDCASALRVKGYLAVRRADMAAGIGALHGALSVEQTAENCMFLAFVEAEAGRIPEAESHAEMSVALDPLSSLGYWSHAVAALLAGRFDLACERMHTAAALARGEPFMSFFVGICSAYAGRMDQALAGFASAAGCAPGPAGMAAIFAAALRGDRPAVIAGLAQESFRDYAQQDKEISWWLAAACAQVGEEDEALAWLARTIDLGFFNHRFLAGLDPFLARLRGTARFDALIDWACAKARALEAELSWIP
jgi:serine/threonine protein kinase